MAVPGILVELDDPEQRTPICLHAWLSRDEIQLLLKLMAKIVILR